MLVHLAHTFLIGGKHLQVIRALERLIDRHGNGNYADYTLKLAFPRNPNGLYLVKEEDLRCAVDSALFAVIARCTLGL
jgi:hypothetical protein